jgi:hypothetical protein
MTKLAAGGRNLMLLNWLPIQNDATTFATNESVHDSLLFEELLGGAAGITQANRGDA